MSTTHLALLLSALAIIPGLGSLGVQLRNQRVQRESSTTEFGTRLAKAAFENLQAQVALLVDEQTRWANDRVVWEEDRRRLITKVNALSDQLALFNLYLRTLLHELERNGIARPVPPPGLDVTIGAPSQP